MPMLEASSFVPHGHCYLWNPKLVGLHVFSDALTAFAYYSIPLTLFYFVRRRPDLPFTWIFLLFSAFIVACGTTHLMEIWTLWYPNYWVSGTIKLLTAITSLTTAILLVPIVPKALALPSPDQYDAMLAAIPDLLLRITRDGSCLNFIPPSDSAAGTFLPIKAHLSEVLSPELLQHQLQRIEQSLVTGELQVWEHQLLKGNKLCDEEVRLAPCGKDEVLVVVRDISDRKLAAKQLELQAIITRNMAEGICLLRATDGIIVYANPKFEQMFGYSSGELNGLHVSTLNYEDEDRALAHQLMRDVMTHGEATYELQNVRKDGTPFWCQATTSMFEHPDYGMVFVAVQQDITERKQAEEFIKASLKEKEVLLKEIHHRVKNNLGVIDGLLQMQARRLQSSEVVEALKESQNRITSIALVHEKLYGSEDLANIDFAQYISQLITHLFNSYNIRFNQIRLITHIEPIPLSVDVAIPCGLIINELISNALKHAFPDSRMGEIQVIFRQPSNQHLCLTVQDNGVGLPSNFQLEQTTTLGMNLVQGLIKQLKGTLSVYPQPEGTAFVITFKRT
ncbi:MAG: histidine kinase dimerization/phosphoacceptor domain -containing protein [Leptolyngbyaceae cyanobacterium bins.302]|nr:histidine kinase dimerization/phosphoacceptor domain -containing protein [Leptolyngbyaceae cyanobacterium bins.302]